MSERQEDERQERTNRIAMLDAEVEVLDIEVQVWQNQLK